MERTKKRLPIWEIREILKKFERSLGGVPEPKRVKGGMIVVTNPKNADTSKKKTR